MIYNPMIISIYLIEELAHLLYIIYCFTKDSSCKPIFGWFKQVLSSQLNLLQITPSLLTYTLAIGVVLWLPLTSWVSFLLAAMLWHSCWHVDTLNSLLFSYSSHSLTCTLAAGAVIVKYYHNTGLYNSWHYIL